MPFYSTTGKLGVNYSDRQTTAQERLGTTDLGTGNSRWVYVQADGAIAAHDYVCIDEDFQARAGTKTNVDAGHAIGIATAAFADNEYGWVCQAGTSYEGLKVNVLANCAADIALYTSATAGSLDDDASGTTRVEGIVLDTAAGGAPAACDCILSRNMADTV